MENTLSLPQNFATAGQPRNAEVTLGRIGKPASQHQPQLDGIRGLAILAVLLSHAAAVIGAPAKDIPGARIFLDVMTPGWGGVDLFFVLSGFLITGILLRSRQRPGYFRTFYVRRALRIFPIYYLVLFASLLVCTQIPVMQGMIRGSQAHLPGTNMAKLSFFLYLQNDPLFWPSMGGGLTGLWGAYWSLAVEEQFYLLWPSVIRFAKSSLLLPVCLLLVCAGPFVRAGVSHLTTDSLGLLQFPLSRVDGLFAGAALAIYQMRKGRPLPLRWALTIGALGATMLGYIAMAHESELTGPRWWMDRFGITGFVLCSASLVAMTQLRLWPVERVLTGRPLRMLGKYSYGLYIFHPAVFLLFGRLQSLLAPRTTSWEALPFALLYDAAAMSLSVLIAMASYRFVEAPFLNLKARFPSLGMPAVNQYGLSATT